MEKQAVLDFLDQHEIKYDVMDHKAIYTIGELYEIDEFPDKDKVAKNLFLRNGNGKKHYLVLLRADKSVDLKALREQIGSSRLGFASEERLMKYLKLKKGSVTPLGVINDETRDIPVIIDKDLMIEDKIGVHPNTNCATVWISHDQLVKAIQAHGSDVVYVEI